MTLQKKIAIIVLAGLAAGLSIFSWVGVQSVQKSVERTLDERLTIAQVLASHLDGYLSYVLKYMQSADLRSGRPTGEEFASTATTLQQIFDKLGIAVKSVMLVSVEGKILNIEPGESSPTGQKLSYPALGQTLEKGIPAISGFESNPLPEAPVVFASVPVFGEQGQIVGALISSIDVKQSDNDGFSPSISLGKTGYVEIIDGNGVILARSAQALPPKVLEKSDHPVRFAELIAQRQATVGTCHRCHETGADVERQRDILAFAPLHTTSWGIAIRQSEEEALAPTRQLEQRFLLLGIIIVISLFLLVWIIMREIVNPIRVLTTAAKRIAAGDFRTPVRVKRKDEIGQLSTAFQTMTRELARSRNELVTRNEELFALNSIGATVSQSLDLEEVLGKALQKVLEVTKTTAAHVFLRGSKNELITAKDIGSSPIFLCKESSCPTATCICYQVLHSGQTTLANHFSQCPNLNGTDDADCFASIPLKSKNRTIGIMNIVGPGDRVFMESDFRLFDSIGYHVGLAIENSVLYEEARYKEELRGQLLSAVITAQEEERKRVSRELHDEFGQIMTGLMMSIESLEDTPNHQPQFVKKLCHAKSLVERAMDNLRRLTLDLRPSVLDDLGLVAAVRAYARTRLEPLGVQIEFEAKGFKKRLAPAIETALFRIAQEAIHNVAKHAEARNVSIKLEAGTDVITTMVEDNGKGFDLEAVTKSKIGSQSLGLLGIKERANLLGGTLTIKSTLGQGTRLVVEIPLAGLNQEQTDKRSG